ncbi:MAG TPA: hypothetical protein VFB27_09290, partial [Opitutaceae bacterium]|nr:hypothetical protein [Opitutaceae bacterium]
DSPVTWRTEQEWRDYFHACDLRVERAESQPRIFRYSTARDFLRSLHGVGAAPQRRMPAGRLRGLLRDYEAKFSVPEGVRATWKFYRIEAVLER